MKKHLLITLFALMALLPNLVQAEICVIVNAANYDNMEIQDIRALFLGRSRSFPQGEFAVVFDQPQNSPVREQFLSKVIGMSPQQANTYWTRLTFAGQATPPQILPDDRAVLEVVRKTPNAIGYLNSVPKNAGVRIILLIKD